jgi:hypothetical protein
MVRTCQIAHAFGTVSCPHRARFDRFIGLLSSTFHVELEFPVYLFESDSAEARLASVKQFCSGLLGRCSHPWRPALRRLSRPKRFSVGMSLFLFRKTLPSSTPSIVKFLESVGSESPAPDQHFLDFIRKEVPILFKKGWDRGRYENAALNSCLTLSSCVQSKRREGGCRMFGISGKSSIFDGRESFIESVLVSDRYPRLLPSRAVAIQTAGKHRIITVPDGNMSVLRPLHVSMYDHISQYSWLLRGDAKAKKFKDFNCVDGELFVSGDYESATDNLNTHVQKEILRLVLSQCTSVPNGIRILAMQSLSLELVSDELPGVTQQRMGQMMGNLLSFPLLCLVNYLAFRYFVRRDVPVRINGDDIVFRARESECRSWMEGVKTSGLTLSKGKTLVDKRCFTLNSCLFYAEKLGCRGLPFIRANSYFPVKDREAILGLKGRFLSFSCNFSASLRSELRVRWLKENIGLINASRRSLTRGLGLPVKLDEVMKAGCWDREAWYLSFESEKALPSPLSEWMSRPDGYQYCRVERISKEQKMLNREVAAAFVEAAWKPPSDDISGWEYNLVGGCPNWGGWAYQRRSGRVHRARLLGLSVANMRRFLKPRISLFERATPRIQRYGVWRPTVSRSTVERSEPEGEDYLYSQSLFTVVNPFTGELTSAEFREWDDCVPPPAYVSYSVCGGPIVPPAELTLRSKGRLVLGKGPLRGSVFKKNIDP